MTEDLYTTSDVARTREKLLKEQGGIDPLTGLEIPAKQAVLDHNHKTQYVRAVLHRQTNAVLGKIENLWTRYLSYWFTGTLSDFLRGAADYLERPDDKRYVHPGWIKRVTIDFKKLNVANQVRVLDALNCNTEGNATVRLKEFEAMIKSRRYTFEEIAKELK